MTSLDGLLRAVEAVFFDFDGPICSVFSGYPAPNVAADMLKVLSAEVGVLPSEIAEETDPMEVLRWTDWNCPHLVSPIDDVLCAAENVAVESAAPAPFAHAAIEAAQRRGQCTAIVSNNSAPAIEKYLRTHRLTSFVDFVAGRPYADPKRMKPNPDSLIRAANALGIKPEAALLVGDTVTDIEACLVADVRPIGYATTARRRTDLENAGAAVVIGSMDALLVTR
ncbi:haloacid dehalogenase superfamily, subfamily IA, variant 1 with third motif having Dx(3-4)D or Dx(3-4)E [Lentzea albidocapillata subsp. violacea]|uniref:Haloacid dehalogenase superfamily, subfamily IA, variant 1 with third motif having Dx(3-4)D or Dx(3-4)E n=1 Tax=Lentzea albidocapillata subsp. violacea TaxID=128104 RepID=A0A1G9X4H5_9PSEU|nr:HAD-IA family hydrolase [Lentzea albidocapillata]SDM91386.1 haloacid dehalogenase superfamily, subfamily IA, variant 1 with third motif having Dx(3-4)D or Dx(3-4)E [Lentzea albidocapillata subsp. violacea]